MSMSCVYILANRRNGTLYASMTSDLEGRIPLHIQKRFDDFTAKYNVSQLMYYELHPDIAAAQRRLKRLKGWKRLWKIRLIEEVNPDWQNLFDTATGKVRSYPMFDCQVAVTPMPAPLSSGDDQRHLTEVPQ